MGTWNERRLRSGGESDNGEVGDGVVNGIKG